MVTYSARIFHESARFTTARDPTSICSPMPAFALKLALGEMATELLLPSTRVVPKKLLEAGYEFKFSDPAAAFSDILKPDGAA